ncbi:MAG: ATP-binding protein [bacterium]|nr:ATP-binding protein [bacterium]
MISRKLKKNIQTYLSEFPVTAILGPRQCGKSTLARCIAKEIKNTIFLDLENWADLSKLSDPLLFFDENKTHLICLDEIQRLPEIFTLLRSLVDENIRNGQFLLLGSASPKLIRQTSESLAGRIGYLKLTPFLYSEIKFKYKLSNYWLRGGFPRSILSSSDEQAFRWLNSFISTYLEKDIIQLGFNISVMNLRRLWMMCAHNHGQTLNMSKLGDSLGISHNTIKKYIEILADTYMIRVIMPYGKNLKKRMIKSPKIYIRDTGILNSLLLINNFNSLMGHPVFGASWESIVIENILSELPDFSYSFYRTSNGNEIDLVVEKGDILYAIECKATTTPKPSKGFWNSIDILKPAKTYIAAPVEKNYSIANNVVVGSFEYIIKDIKNIDKMKESNAKTVKYLKEIDKL